MRSNSGPVAFLSRDSGMHFQYSAAVSPLVRIPSGGRIIVETHDARFGALLGRRTGEPYELPLPQPGRGNPVNGPIEIEKARPGDSILITIETVEVGHLGWCGAHAHVGPTSSGYIPSPVGRTCEISDGMIEFSAALSIDSSPMIGCIGTAPETPLSTALSGRHGGNMDQTIMCAGTQVQLPVLVEGAQVFVGDLHAAQGDGELSGVALEVPGEVEMTIDLESDSISWPWAFTQDKIAVLTTGATFEEARAQAVENVIRAIESVYRLEPADALALISVVGDLRIGQSWGGDQITLRLEMPRSLMLRPVP